MDFPRGRPQEATGCAIHSSACTAASIRELHIETGAGIPCPPAPHGVAPEVSIAVPACIKRRVSVVQKWISTRPVDRRKRVGWRGWRYGRKQGGLSPKTICTGAGSVCTPQAQEIGTLHSSNPHHVESCSGSRRPCDRQSTCKSWKNHSNRATTNKPEQVAGVY